MVIFSVMILTLEFLGGMNSVVLTDARFGWEAGCGGHQVDGCAKSPMTLIRSGRLKYE